MIDPIELQKRIYSDPNSFQEIISEYEEKILRYIQRISAFEYEEAQNILQEVFLKVYIHINEYDPRWSFSGWIYRIAHNEIIDSYRKNKKRSNDISLSESEYEKVFEVLSEGNPLVEFQKEEIRNCIRNGISMLPEEYREVFILRYLEERSYEEISDILLLPL